MNSLTVVAETISVEERLQDKVTSPEAKLKMENNQILQESTKEVEDSIPDEKIPEESKEIEKSPDSDEAAPIESTTESTEKTGLLEDGYLDTTSVVEEIDPAIIGNFMVKARDMGGKDNILREKDSSNEVSINWNVLNNAGYNFAFQLDNFETVTERQVKLKIPKGVIISISALDALKNAQKNIIDYKISEKNEDIIYKIDANFQKTVFVDQKNGSGIYSKDSVTDATITFNLDPTVGTIGFNLSLLPNYEDGANNNNSPNYWTGVLGDSLTRGEPIEVSVVENTATVKTLILDDIKIANQVSYPVVTGDPAVANSTVPGSQLLDEVMQMYIQPRVRNGDNPSVNANFMGNVLFKAYLPYKKIGTDRYLSAALATNQMDAWISEVTGKNGGGSSFKI